jgi:hypothetical protein
MNHITRSFLPILTLAAALCASGQTTTATPAPAPAAAAPAPEAAPAGSWTLTECICSQYMFRGVRLDGISMEPNLEYDQGNLAVGVWSNFPLRDKVPGQSDPEFDIYGTYKIETIKDVASVVPGFTWYNYPRAVKANGFYKYTFEPNVAFNYTVSGVTLTPKLYYDLVLKGPTYELNAAYTVPVKEANSELDFAATVGTFDWTSAIPDAKPEVKNKGSYFSFGATMPFVPAKDAKFTVGVAWVKGFSNTFEQGGSKVDNTAAVSRVVVTLNYAISF